MLLTTTFLWVLLREKDSDNLWPQTNFYRLLSALVFDIKEVLIIGFQDIANFWEEDSELILIKKVMKHLKIFNFCIQGIIEKVLDCTTFVSLSPRGRSKLYYIFEALDYCFEFFHLQKTPFVTLKFSLKSLNWKTSISTTAATTST